MNTRIYELSYDGYRLGLFPTEAEARHHAAYMPKGCYSIREWTEEDEFMVFDTKTNKTYQFYN